MRAPETILEILGAHGGRIDVAARALLSRGDSALYGMLRYAMGYADESLAPVSGTFGGKRFRSGLLLMMADEYRAGERALPLALSIEVFHNFSLIHDDIMDRDEMRRGRPTVWKLWGVDRALNAGDAQLVLALLALEDAEPALRDIARPFLLTQYLGVIEGQHEDAELAAAPLSDSLVNETSYLRMIEKKSGVLVAAALRAAGIAGGAAKTECDTLSRFGLSLGLAYQVRDDIASVWDVSAATGKPPQGDVRERKKTLPVILAAKTLPDDARKELVSLYAKTEPLSEADITRATQLLEQANAREATWAFVERYKGEALVALKALSISESGKESFRKLTEALLSPIAI